MIITQYYQLFGPQHIGYTSVAPPAWNWMDTANSSSSKYIAFRGGPKSVDWATFSAMWQPGVTGGSKIRCVAMDTGGDGYGRWDEIGVLQGKSGPRWYPDGIEVTPNIRDFIEKGQDRYIGFQVWGDGVHPHTICEVRLMIDWVFTAK